MPNDFSFCQLPQSKVHVDKLLDLLTRFRDQIDDLLVKLADDRDRYDSGVDKSPENDGNEGANRG